MSKQLHVIVLGASHSNFIVPKVLRHQIQLLNDKQIPCSFTQEGPSDHSLSKEIESTLSGLQQNEVFKRYAPEINKWYIKDKKLSHPYLPKEAWEPIRTIVRNKILPALGLSDKDEGFIEQIVLEFFRDGAYKEDIAFYQELERRHISFANLDAATSIYNAQVIGSAGSKETYINNEQNRIDEMVKNLSRHLSEKLPKGGVVFASTGRHHAKRLAANLVRHFREHPLDSLDIVVNVHLVKVNSSFDPILDEELTHVAQLTDALDSLEIKQIYQTLPCIEAEGLEKKGKARIPELESLVDTLIKQYFVSEVTLKGPARSIFSPLPPHEQFVQAVKAYLKEKQLGKNESILQSIEVDKDYSSALRKACILGETGLVTLFINYSDQLSIDLGARSSNGRTAADWFNHSMASEIDKSEVAALLEKKCLPTKQAVSTMS